MPFLTYKHSLSIHMPQREPQRPDKSSATLRDATAGALASKFSQPTVAKPQVPPSREEQGPITPTACAAWECNPGLTAPFARKTLLVNTSCRCTITIPCKGPEARAIFGLLDKAVHPQHARIFKTCFGSLYAQYCLGKERLFG